MGVEENPEWVEVSLPVPAEPISPPDRYAVPATTMPPLASPQLVTIGDPEAGWWLVDEAEVVGGPRGQGDEEWYLVAPVTELTATLLRQDPTQEAVVGPEEGPEAREVHAVRRRTSDLWVYRDVPDSERPAVDVEPFDPARWFDRVGPADAPPPLRRARPARELPSLIGQTLRARQADSWAWVVALTEPCSVEGDIIVRCASFEVTAELRAGRPARDLREIQLHLLWAY